MTKGPETCVGHIIAMWRSKPQKMFGESSELGSPESVSRCAQQQPANHATDPYLAPFCPFPKLKRPIEQRPKPARGKDLLYATQYWLNTHDYKPESIFNVTSSSDIR
eukprot:s1809_g19.t1